MGFDQEDFSPSHPPAPPCAGGAFGRRLRLWNSGRSAIHKDLIPTLWIYTMEYLMIRLSHRAQAFAVSLGLFAARYDEVELQTKMLDRSLLGAGL